MSDKKVLVNGVMTSLDSYKASLPDRPKREPKPLVTDVEEELDDTTEEVELSGDLVKLEKMELGELKAFAVDKFEHKRNATKKKMLELFKGYYENGDNGSSEL